MKIHKNFKNKLLLVYLISTLMAALGSGILLKEQWDESIKTSGIIALKDLEITSGITKNIISNGSKLLDVTNKELHQLILNHQYDAKSIEKTISFTSSLFSLDKDVKNYGLLLVTDKDGDLIARSDGLRPSHLNFKDRYYFQELKNKPDRLFVIGPLLQARTTNKHVFHFAEPIKDTNGQFKGALVLQISEDSVIEAIKIAIHSSNETITALTENNEVIFTTSPDQVNPNTLSGLQFSDLHPNLKIRESQKWSKTDGMVSAQIDSPTLKIKYISVQPISKILSNFFELRSNILMLASISYLIFSYLMWFIYHQFIEAEKVRMSAHTDPLTLLPNRRAFDERYELLLKDSIRSHSDISVLFIDIDRFKNCNDAYGHENGDLVLKKLAEIIQYSLRRPLDFCCRWGGEELVALLPDTNEAGASKVAQQILDTVRSTPIALHGHPPIHITVSVGIACGHHLANYAADNNLVDRADQAMYRAKQAGRDRYST